MNTPSDPTPPVAFESASRPSFRWLLFTLALLLPPILTFATAMAGWENFPTICPFVGGGLSGLVCGILLGRYVGRTKTAVALFSLLFVVLFAGLSFALCFGGCLAGGYKVMM